MLKKLLRFCFISAVLVVAGCAPRVTTAPPPQYIDRELSLRDIVAAAGGDIEVLKAIADIKIEKNNRPYDFINASILLRKPDMLHMRIYKFGMLVKDFVIKDGKLYVLSGKGSGGLKKLGDEFYSAVFWWDDMDGAVMDTRGGEYIIRSKDRVIHIDRATLLPVRQALKAFNNRKILITYSRPVNNGGFWYPSLIEISAGEFRFTVRLKKLLKNPAPRRLDFRIPVES